MRRITLLTPALQKVDRHHDLLAWAMEDAFDRGDYSTAVDLMRYIGYALGIRGHHDLRLGCAKIAIEAARRAGLHAEEAANLVTNAAWVHFMWYQFDFCEEKTREGLDLARKVADERTEAIALRNLGLVAKERGDLMTAESYLTRALDMFSDQYEGHVLSSTEKEDLEALVAKQSLESLEDVLVVVNQEQSVRPHHR